MASIFTKILNKEIDGHVITETERFFAILDKFPTQPGHTLVIPKEETDYIFDLDDDTYQKLWQEVRRVARAIERVTGVQKVGIKVEGLEIRHVHVHLIPINKAADFNGTVSVPEEEQARMRDRIANELH